VHSDLAPPHLTVHTLETTEGGSVPLTTDTISVLDADTDISELILTLESEPMFGQLVRGGLKMVEGEQFGFADLIMETIR